MHSISSGDTEVLDYLVKLCVNESIITAVNLNGMVLMAIYEDSSPLGCSTASYFEVIHIGLLDPEDKFNVIFRDFGKRWLNIATTQCT
jgi:hypothetical protein